MFWSRVDFEEEQLIVKRKKFKDASIFYNHVNEVKLSNLKRWLVKAREIRWDYRNLVSR